MTGSIQKRKPTFFDFIFLKSNSRQSVELDSFSEKSILNENDSITQHDVEFHRSLKSEEIWKSEDEPDDKTEADVSFQSGLVPYACLMITFYQLGPLLNFVM